MKVRLSLLWLAGIDLRLTLLAVPPVLPAIHRDLHLTETGVAALSNLPVLTLAGSSVFGALLVSRLGTRRALIAALWIVALASGLRGIGPSVPLLFATTLVMGLGVALLQPVFPALSREWFPTRVALATAIWSNGLLAGEGIGAALTPLVVLPLVGGSWEGSFAVWGASVALVALAVTAFGGRGEDRTAMAPMRWLPNFRDERLWEIGILQAAASLTYFGANTFIPDYLHVNHQAQFVAPALIALNLGQLPASLAFGLVPLRIIGHWVTCTVMALLLAAAVGIFLFFGGWLGVAAAAFIGFWGAYTLILSFALPPLIAPAGDVARMSAGAFTIGYSVAFAMTLLAGALWDYTHLSATAFLPIGLAVVILIVLGPRLGAAAHLAEAAQR
jgi:CP family cyanate transporter-like MFS transporter